VVDADGRDRRREVFHAERLDEIRAQRVPRLGAQPPHVARRVIAAERGEVHERDGAQQPRRLPFLLHRPACAQRRGTTLDGASIYAKAANDVEVERNSRIAFDSVTGKRARRCDEREVRLGGHPLQCTPGTAPLNWLLATGSRLVNWIPVIDDDHDRGKVPRPQRWLDRGAVAGDYNHQMTRIDESGCRIARLL
jgi:hypothetical protein